MIFVILEGVVLKVIGLVFLVIIFLILNVGDCGFFFWLLFVGREIVGDFCIVGICIIDDIIVMGWRVGGSGILSVLFVIGCGGGGMGIVVMGIGCIWINCVVLVIGVIFFGSCGRLCGNLFILVGIDIIIGIWLIFGIIECWVMFDIGIICDCIVIWLLVGIFGEGIIVIFSDNCWEIIVGIKLFIIVDVFCCGRIFCSVVICRLWLIWIVFGCSFFVLIGFNGIGCGNEILVIDGIIEGDVVGGIVDDCKVGYFGKERNFI